MGFNKLAPGEYDKKPFVEKQSLPKDIDWDNLTEEEIERLANIVTGKQIGRAHV